MRLTLRTMLAHLDGILDPADSEDLARKIAENEFAATLAQRIGDCTKRLRLGAPKVLGKGTALDPNTVAEYLDSTLAAERMPDFEKVCLESDVHLAEVAACHHILTMIVGQPVQVDIESRRRMYGLVAAGETGPIASGAAVSGTAEMIGAAVRAAESATPVAHESISDEAMTSVDGFPSQAKPQPRKAAVPDYLREGARQRKMTTAMIAIAAVGLTIAVLAFKDPLLSMVGLGPATKEAVSDAGDGTNHGDKRNEGGANENGGATNDAAENAAAGVSKGPQASEPATGGRDADAIGPEKSSAAKLGGDPGGNAPLPGEAFEPSNNPPLPATTSPPSPQDATNDAGNPDADAPNTATPRTVPGDAPRQPDAAPRLERAEPVGKLVSGDQLLLRFDVQAGDGGDWLRVPDGGMVYGGDRIVALPTFRPRLVLSDGLLVELVADSHDGTIVEMLAADANGTPGMRVVHGRLAKISASGKQGIPLRLAFGKQTATITLSDTTSSLAVSVDRPYAPGEDPMGVADPVMATFYATSGSVDVAVEGARPVTVNEAMHLVVLPAGPAQPEPTSPPPQWVDKSQVEYLDTSAATQLMLELTATSSVGVELSEQFHGRRIEGQSLAARSFGYLGRFDPLIATGLKDDKLVWTWREKSLEGLRQAMRRGPATAVVVRDGLVKEFGDRNGGVMYRMLCGYSQSDLKNGADEKLVENLSHEELAFRSLAQFNLVSITGKNWGYKPEARENFRRSSVARWREQLQRREIVYSDGGKSPARVANAPAAKDASGVDVGPLGEAPADAPAATPATPTTPGDVPANFPPPAAGPDGR
ncbi:MAG: hypothetical protein WD875_14090 [Pirellulales bacterium]